MNRMVCGAAELTRRGCASSPGGNPFEAALAALLFCSACGINEVTKYEAERTSDSPSTETGAGTDGDSASLGETDSDSNGGPLDTGGDPSDTGEGRGDTETVTLRCPEGATPHVTESGRTVCCTPSHPQFCDENELGYEGGCWGEGIRCDALIECGGRWLACSEGTVPFCNEEERLICYPCEDGAIVHRTASGRPVCCNSERPTFCDEADGYQGGCWGAGVLCDTITLCDGRWLACQDGMLPFCDAEGDMVCVPCPETSTRYETASGRPVCCSASLPRFCDETASGYPGGCWSEQIDCETIAPCGDYWGGCPTGLTAVCEAGGITCE